MEILPSSGGGGGGSIGFSSSGGRGCGSEATLDTAESGVLELCKCGNTIGLTWAVVNTEHEKKNNALII